MPNRFKNFWVYNYKTRSVNEIKTRLVYERNNVSLYLERDKDLPQSTIETIGREFDETIYPQLSNSFAQPTDIDGNGKVIIVLMDIQDEYNPPEQLGFVAGMFQRSDLSNGLFSNSGEILYIDIDPGLTYSGSLELALSTTAHEYFHLLDFSQGNNRQTWLAESMAVAAEYVYDADASSDRLDLFAAGGGNYPGTRPISMGNHFLSFELLASDYSSAYVFMQWLAGHSNEGDAIFDSLFTPGAQNVTDFALQVNADGGFANPAPVSGMSELLLDWHIANAVNAAAKVDDQDWSAWNSLTNLYSYSGKASVADAIRSPWIFADPDWFANKNLTLAPGDALYMMHHDQDSELALGQGPNIRFIGLDRLAPGTVLNNVDSDHDIIIVYNANSDPDGNPELTGILPPARTVIDSNYPVFNGLPAASMQTTDVRSRSITYPLPVRIHGYR